MAANMSAEAAATTSEGSSQKRVNWSAATTGALIRIWEDNLPVLHSNMRNQRIYSALAEMLNARLPSGEGPYSAKQIRQKLENLNKQYRKLRRSGTVAGSKGVDWPFYWLLHAFLGTLPINNSNLIEESPKVPDAPEAEESGEVVATLEFEAPQHETFEDTATSLQQSEVANNSTTRRRKRPASSLLQELMMTVHQQAEDCGAKAAKQSTELRKQLLELQKESNQIQQGMLDVMRSYFTPNKSQE